MRCLVDVYARVGSNRGDHSSGQIKSSGSEASGPWHSWAVYLKSILFRGTCAVKAEFGLRPRSEIVVMV